MVEEIYKKLKGNFKLPEYEKLNNEFEISSIDCEDFLLREIRRKITEKICFFADMIGGVVNTESSSSAMIEFSNLTENDMKKAFVVYKKLMYIERYSAEASISAKDEKDVEFINNVYKEWMELKQDIEEMIVKLKESWQIQGKNEEEPYFL